MLRERVITAVVLLVAFLAALFALPSVGWALLVAAMVMQGASEWTRLAGLQGNSATRYWWATLALVVGLYAFDAGAAVEQRIAVHRLVYQASAIFWVFAVPAWLVAGWRPKQAWLMPLVGWLVLIPTGLAMIDLRAVSPWWLLAVMVLVWVADSAAYFTGRKFGKHKLAPAISPGKTWEGVVGAVAACSLYVLLTIWLTGEYKSVQTFSVAMFASWCWVVMAVLGDLFESFVKRQAGVKDSGALLPGHGGLLDRIDALTSTLPLAALVFALKSLS